MMSSAQPSTPKGIDFSYDESLNWFRLFSLRGMNSESVQRIRVRAQAAGISIAKIFKLSENQFEEVFYPDGAILKEAVAEENYEDVLSEYTVLNEKGISLVYPGDEHYPLRLVHLYLTEAPALLFMKGNPNLISAQSIAIVGSRDTNDNTIELTREFASQAAVNGFNVISGYARGIDIAAHVGAILGGGTTTMVLPIGIDGFKVRKQIFGLPWEENSLIISQFAPKENWKKHYGLIRNKLIVGLSEAVLVIRADIKSGSIYTGNRALKNGIPLFVLSNDILNEQAEGNDKLIENGGIEIEKMENILDYLRK